MRMKSLDLVLAGILYIASSIATNSSDCPKFKTQETCDPNYCIFHPGSGSPQPICDSQCSTLAYNERVCTNQQTCDYVRGKCTPKTSNCYMQYANEEGCLKQNPNCIFYPAVSQSCTPSAAFEKACSKFTTFSTCEDNNSCLFIATDQSCSFNPDTCSLSNCNTQFCTATTVCQAKGVICGIIPKDQCAGVCSWSDTYQACLDSCESKSDSSCKGACELKTTQCDTIKSKIGTTCSSLTTDKACSGNNACLVTSKGSCVPDKMACFYTSQCMTAKCTYIPQQNARCSNPICDVQDYQNCQSGCFPVPPACIPSDPFACGRETNQNSCEMAPFCVYKYLPYCAAKDPGDLSNGVLIFITFFSTLLTLLF